MRPQFFLLPVLTLSLQTLAYDVRTDSEGDVVHWTHSLELVLDQRALQYLDVAEAEGAIRAAVMHLDEATPYLDVALRVGAAKPIGYQMGATDNTNSIVALEDWPYSEDALAVTLVTLNARTNELLDADVAFNVEKHRFRVLPEETRKETPLFDDVQNTITHELGHVLGLMHNDHAADLVMFPSAPPGEVVKRELKQDDRDGLLSLYGQPLVEGGAELMPFGCSSTGNGLVWMLAPVLLLGLRRRRWSAVLAASLPAMVLAAEPQVAAVERATDVAVVQVASRQSRVHPTNPGLIITTLSFARRECLKGQCLRLDEVIVPGGRVGDLEQFVAHEPVPLEGAEVIVTRTSGKVRVLRVDTHVQAQVIRALRSGSVLPQQPERPHSSPAQVPAIAP